MTLRTTAYKATDLRLRRIFRKLSASDLDLIFALMHSPRGRRWMLAHLEEVLDRKAAAADRIPIGPELLRGRRMQLLREYLYLVCHDRDIFPDNESLIERLNLGLEMSLDPDEFRQTGREAILRRTWAHLLALGLEERCTLLREFLDAQTHCDPKGTLYDYPKAIRNVEWWVKI